MSASLMLMGMLRRPSLITDRFYQGGIPDPSRVSRNFDVLVLMAREHQPPAAAFPGVEVLHMPIDDSMKPLGRRQLAQIYHLAGRVCRRLRSGKRVLVTCAAGLNRSGLVTALALLRCAPRPPEVIIQLIRARRSPRALSNPYFEAIVRQSVRRR